MKKILDACCSARQFWFQPKYRDAVFVDCRSCDEVLSDGRTIEIKPDIIADFRNLPFPDQSFYHVVFDPPHIKGLGRNSFMGKRFGVLDDEWESLIRDGFSECWRVLKENGSLVFKWNEYSIKTSEILKILPQTPIYGHKSGKLAKTQWLVFFKNSDNCKAWPHDPEPFESEDHDNDETIYNETIIYQ